MRLTSTHRGLKRRTLVKLPTVPPCRMEHLTGGCGGDEEGTEAGAMGFCKGLVVAAMRRAVEV